MYVFGVGGLDSSDSANGAKDTSSNKLSTFDCFRIAAYLDSVAALAWPKPTDTPPTHQPALAASPLHLVVLVPSAADAASLWELIIAAQVWKVGRSKA